MLGEGLLDLVDVDVRVAEGALLRDQLQLRAEPLVDALRVEQVLAHRDLTHGHTLLEILETDHAFRLLKVVDTLVIGSLSDQSQQLVHPLFLSLSLILKILPQLNLIILDLFFELTFSNAHSNNSADANANKREH